MIELLAAVAAVVAVLCAAPPRRARQRLAAMTAPARPRKASSSPAAPVVLLAAPAAVLLVGSTFNLWAGLAAGGVAVLLGRRRPADDPALDVPLVADLLAACLAAGATPIDALRAAGDSSAAAAGVCRPVAGRLAMGLAPPEAWADWLARPDLATIARACIRAAETGAATTQELQRAGERARSRRRADLARRAHRAGVWAVLPLGLCFLPAFVLVGIVPFALGLLRH